MSWIQQKKCEQLLAQERGYRQKIWRNNLTVCLAYPNRYRVGMSNLGFQAVYTLLNRLPFCLCERVFFPEADSPREEALLSLESQRPLKDFDIVAFAIPFENDYPHVLIMLEQAGIALQAEMRSDPQPLIMAGGVAVTLNPEPLSAFIDLFLLGEAEEMLPEFAERYWNDLKKGLNRRERLSSIQQKVPGAYAPELYSVLYQPDGTIAEIKPKDPAYPEKIRRRWIQDLSAFITEQTITTSATEFGDLFLSEVSRGCLRGCRFCAAGFVYRPVRFRTNEILEPSFIRGIEQGKKIGLLGTAVSDHPHLLELCRFILEKGGNFSLSSLRLDRISAEMAGLLGKSGVESVALAPEAGTQRLRDVIHKGITEEHIFEALDHLIPEGIRQVRLYFMIGLPTETEADIDGLISLTRKIRHHSLQVSQGKRPLRLTLSINQFIPKPATPFQWHPLEDIRVVKKKFQRIERELRQEGSVRVFHDLPKWNYIQTLLSLGDRRVGRILLEVHKLHGNWVQALKKVDLNADFYVYRPKDVLHEILPWDFIDHGIERSRLVREYTRALSGNP